MRALLLLQFLVASSCSQPPDYPPARSAELAQFSMLDLSKAKRDAREAVASGDFRLVGVMGFSWEYPGIDPSAGEYIAAEHGSRFVPGTSDFITSSSERRFNDDARRYATAYNQELIRHLPKGAWFQSPPTPR